MDEEIIVNPFEDDDFEDEQNVYRTYKMDFKNKRISGMVEGKEAAIQSICKILSTRRYAYLIYDDQYGFDIFNKIGNTDLTDEYLDSDIPVMVEDALLPEDMIIGISDASYEMLRRDSVEVYLEAETIYGEIELEGVIRDG